MEWRDDGFVLAARRHGESALIVELLTREHGRHAGLVRGGQSPRRRALLQPGNAISAFWRGRLPEHLGTLECELVGAHAARLLEDADRLAALNAAVALLVACLPEREPHADLHASFAELLTALTSGENIRHSGAPHSGEPGIQPQTPHPASSFRASPSGQSRNDDVVEQCSWPETYVLWECHLLAALGFGLDLGSCAATGTNQDLAYVSPRSGRAVSRDAGQPYHDKMLPLPEFLWRDSPATADDIVAGLVLTRHFLLHHVLEPQGGRLPEARERLLDRLRRHTQHRV